MRLSFVITVAATSLLIGSALAQAPTQSGPSDQAPSAQPAAPQAPEAARPPADARSAPAQAAPESAAKGPSNPAVRTSEGNNPNASAPVAGANSFTEGEAKSRIEARGFTNVTALKKDDQGIWRGQAQKDGKTVQVALDFQGNVFAN